jgi:tetratricopeptide (TPR) repeat protein
MINLTILRTTFVAVLAASAILCGTCPVFATGAEPATNPQADPAPCAAAAAADDADKTIAVCGALIDKEKTPRAERIKALIARAGAYERKDQFDRAIGDYDTVLRLDSTLADIFNSRGELWRKKGDRPRALQDFAAAIKLNPDHAAAKGNYKNWSGWARRWRLPTSRVLTAPPPNARSRKRSAPIPNWPISTARSTA